MDSEHSEDMEIARKVMRDCEEALRELSGIAAEPRPTTERLPDVPPASTAPATKSVRKAEGKLDSGDE